MRIDTKYNIGQKVWRIGDWGGSWEMQSARCRKIKDITIAIESGRCDIIYYFDFRHLAESHFEADLFLTLKLALAERDKRNKEVSNDEN